MGTRTRILAAAVAVFALAVAVPVGAQDSHPEVVLVYSDTSVDRPIAIAVAELNELHGEGITLALSVDQVAATPDAYTGSCIVAVGKSGVDTAEYLQDEFALPAMEAQGRDRDETAWLVAKRVVSDC